MESHKCSSVGGRSLRCLVRDEAMDEVGPVLQGGDTDGVNLPVLLLKQKLLQVAWRRMGQRKGWWFDT
ncbi:hypothetical protein PBY51_004767 [Eleginops maclovinus]|uniref:Uncharacterized protein n=1 Tax=Eleginops maclovinus TaxID=56733 RepID=A0AAN7X4T2_ELEMC|nr:hypothetical protein PBY51_004767 [Eleginops maclovinus]